MANDDKIDFDQLGIANVLKNYGLSVPRYQRDYSWTKDETLTFLRDISLAINQDESIYFLGSLVVIYKEGNRREVVDGQQRLATTSLLLAAIKAVSDQHSNVRRSVDQFLVSLDLQTIDQTKLTLNLSDSAVFSSLVTTGEVGEDFIKLRPSHKKLYDTYKECKDFITKAVNQVAPQDQDTILVRWVNFLQFNASVILISVSTDLNAFRMFETLNDRGLKVSQSDLIKNYLFSLSGDQIEKAQSSWVKVSSTLEHLGGKDELMMNFIRHVLMATDSFVQRKDIYRKVQGIVKGENSSVDFLSRLEKLSTMYVAISNPESVEWRGYPHLIKEHIKVINLFDIQPLKPLLISSATNFSEQECERFFKSMISISVRLTIASVSRTTSQAVEGPISEVAIKIWKREIETSSEAVAGLGAAIPNDSIFKDSFLTASVSKRPLARYYLRTLERTHKGEEDPSHIPNEDPRSVTLEHVLPEEPQENWPQFKDEEHATYLRRIGNLALLRASENEAASSDSFEEKIKVFRNSTFSTTSHIAEFAKWDSESIRERQKVLADIAIKSWPVN